MRQINWSELLRQGASKIEKFLPVQVTADGEVKFIVCKAEDVLVLKGMHIRVQNQLRALHKRASIGMPADVKLTAEDF